MGVHEFYTTIEQNDIIGLVDSLAEKAGTPYHGAVPSGSTTANIQHDLDTNDVDVTVYRVNDGVQVGVPATRVDENNVELTFATAPLGGEYRVIVSAGTGAAGGGGGGGGGGAPDPHAASHASNGTDPVSPASIGAALSSHNHSSDYAPLTHASRHATAGADPISPSSIGAASSVHSHSGTDITSGTVGFARLPTGTTSTTVAVGNHTHSGIGAHASTHALGGTDPLTADDIGASSVLHDHNGRIIPAGGTTGQALIKSSADDYDVEWGTVSGGDTPVYDPSVIKPFPAVNIIPTQFKYSINGSGSFTALTARINASLGTHFRIDYTYVSGVEQIQALRIDNPTDGQSILIEYRNLSSAGSLDQSGLDLAFLERNWQAGTPYGTVSGQTPGPSDITNFDLGGIYPESVMWQSCAYYGLMYDARARAGAGAWRLLSNVTGYSV